MVDVARRLRSLPPIPPELPAPVRTFQARVLALALAAVAATPEVQGSEQDEVVRSLITFRSTGGGGGILRPPKALEGTVNRVPRGIRVSPMPLTDPEPVLEPGLRPVPFEEDVGRLPPSLLTPSRSSLDPETLLPPLLQPVPLQPGAENRIPRGIAVGKLAEPDDPVAGPRFLERPESIPGAVQRVPAGIRVAPSVEAEELVLGQVLRSVSRETSEVLPRWITVVRHQRYVEFRHAPFLVSVPREPPVDRLPPRPLLGRLAMDPELAPPPILFAPPVELPPEPTFRQRGIERVAGVFAPYGPLDTWLRFYGLVGAKSPCASPPAVPGTPTELDTDFLATVLELVEEFGKTVDFIELPSYSYDPATVDATLGPETTHSVKVSPPEGNRRRFAEGGLWRQGFCRFFLPASGLLFTPELGQRVDFDGQRWQIVKLVRIFAGQKFVAFEVFLRDAGAPPTLGSTSTPLDTEFAATVVELIDDFGKELTFTDDPTETYDASTLDTVPGSPVAYTQKASPPEPFALSLRDGTLIQTGDMHFLIPGSGLAFLPDLGMHVLFDGTDWQIVGLEAIYSGFQIAAYEVHIRGGGVPASLSSAFAELDAEFVDLALELVDELGKEVVFDLRDGWTYLHSQVDRSGGDCGPFYLLKISPPEPFKDEYVARGLVAEGDHQALLPAKDLAFVPETGIRVTVDDELWIVVEVEPIYSGEQIAAYGLRLRR